MDGFAYNYKELLGLIKELSKIYDVVRIVDPFVCCEVNVSEDGEISNGKNCYDAWSTLQRCKNCHSIRACMSGRRIEKTEYHNDSTYRILTIPIDFVIADGTPVRYALECITVSKGINREPGVDKTSFDKENEISMYDYLTGIFNREGFFRNGEKLLRENPNEQFVAVVYNIRRFKVLTEMFGRQKSNEILIFMANVMATKCTPRGIAARLNRDNFVIILPKSEFNEDMIMSGFEYLDDIIEGKNYNIVVQAGIYVIDEKGLAVSVIFDRCMLALNKIYSDLLIPYCYFNRSIMDEVLHEQDIVGTFSDALKNQQIKIYLQPQVSENGKIQGAEALARWVKEDGEVIQPASFIGILEKSNLITELDKYVWEESVKLIKKWENTSRKDLYISVNISPKDFFYVDIFAFFVGLVEKYQIDKSKLKLEITESVIMNDSAKQISVVNQLHDYGFDIEIDDFGKGFSSLSLLKDINADVIKIDREFLKESDNKKKSEQILNSMISMSGCLELKVITEGVETKEQLDKLVKMGCKSFQGFYFARPMSVEKFEEYC